MSARDELYALAICGDDRTADEKIDAYRAEVLRGAAQEIRRWADKNQPFFLEGERTGARMAADLIDGPTS